MALGEQAIAIVRHHLTLPLHTSIRQISGESQEPSNQQR
jgi:hypothetical protein